MKYHNVAIIWQPHFVSGCFRVDAKKQRGKDKNYIIVVGSPSYNGLWSWEVNPDKIYEHKRNKSIDCICIPIDDCKFEQGLKECKNDELLKEIRKEQVKCIKAMKLKKQPDWVI